MIGLPENLSQKNFKIIPAAGKSKKILIIFSGTGKGNGKFDFYKIGHSLDVHVILINNQENRWYQDGVPGIGDSIKKTYHQLRLWGENLAGGDDCEFYTCGTSMGGFAAVLYGSKLEGKAFTFGLDTRIGLRYSPSDRLLKSDTVIKVPDLNSIIKKHGIPIWGLIGEMDCFDLMSAQSMSHHSNVTLQILRGVDHAVPRYLQDRGILKDLMIRFVNNLSLPTLMNSSDILKHNVVDLLYKLNTYYAENDNDKARETAHKIIERIPYQETAQFTLARIDLKEGNLKEALKNLSLLHKTSPYSAEITFHYGRALRVNKKHNEALDVFSALIDYNNARTSARSHYDSGLCHLSLKNKTEAIKSLQKAVELSPDNKSFKNRLDKVLNEG